MSRFNTYFNSDFSGCKLIAETHDPYRDRPIRVFWIPGEDSFVGVSDGTDRWIAPVAGDPFGINIRQVMADVRAGKSHYRPPASGRKRLLIDDQSEPEGKPRRKLLTQEEPIRRRHVVQA